MLFTVHKISVSFLFFISSTCGSSQHLQSLSFLFSKVLRFVHFLVCPNSCTPRILIPIPVLVIAVNDMSQLSLLQVQILTALRAAPWTTVDQLARRANRSVARVYADLQLLLAGGLVQRVNPRSPHFELRAVYALTDRAVRALASRAGMEERAYRERYAISRTCHAELLWRIELVWRVREIGLGLTSKGWSLESFHVLRRVSYRLRYEEKTIQFHGCGKLVQQDGNTLPFVVEWDDGKWVWDLNRLGQFSEWLDPYWFHDKETNYPCVLIVTANRARLDALWNILHEPAHRWMWKAPALHLTTQEKVERHGPHGKIWLDVERNQWKRWYDEEPRYPKTYLPFSIVSLARHGRIGNFESQPDSAKPVSTPERLLRLKVSLSAQAKRVLLRVATRPLLSVSELAWLMSEHPDRVGKALQELVQGGLVEQFEHAGTHRHILTSLGTRYEAAEQGYGRAVKQYLRRSGGRSGVKRLKYHFEHTIATNDFFLAWVRLARAKEIRFEWRSELECARYFRRGSTLHRLLPDGEGIWHAGDQPFHFLVEIDRSRESPQNLAAKFEEYFQWRHWREARSPWEPDPDLLFVTTSWNQAKVIAEAMQERSYGVFQVYPLWVTTFEAVTEHGLNGWIWRYGPKSEGFCRLPCFVEPKREGNVQLETNAGEKYQN